MKQQNIDPIIYLALGALLSSKQVGDRRSNALNEAESYQGWNFAAIQTLTREAASAHAYVYNDSGPNAAAKRASLKKRFGSNWKSFAQDGASELLASDHPAVRLVERPNPSCRGGLFRWEYIVQMHLHGSCLIFNRPNQLGTRTVERYILPLALTEPVYAGQYQNTPNGGVRVLPYQAGTGLWSNDAVSKLAYRVIPIECLDLIQYPDPYLRGSGRSPSDAAGWWIDTAAMIDKTRWKHLKRGPKAAAVLSVELGEDETDPVERLEELEKHVNRTTGSDDIDGRIKVLSNASSLNTNVTPEEMRYVESFDQMAESIAAVHGSSKALMGLTDNMTFGSLAAAIKLGVRVVQSDLDLLAENFTDLFEVEYEEKLTCEFEVQGMEDPAVTEQRISTDVTAGVYTVREYRSLRGLPPLGDERDEYRVTPQGFVKDEVTKKPLAFSMQRALNSDWWKPSDTPSFTVIFDSAMDDGRMADVYEKLDKASVRYAVINSDGVIEGSVQGDEVLVPSEAYSGTTMDRIEAIAALLPEKESKSLLSVKTEYKYGCVMADMPEAVRAAVVLIQSDIDESQLVGDGIELEPHVTILYGVTGCDMGEVLKVVRSIPAMDVVFGETSYWDNEKECVLKIDVESKALSEANAKLQNCLPHNQSDWGSYKAHLTLAYCTKDEAERFVGPNSLTGKSARLTHAVVSMNGEKVKVPLR